MKDKPILVIHHDADFDGLFCREIAKRYFGSRAEYLGWDYGRPEPEVPDETELYLLDISVPGLMNHPRLIWIDHHKSAMEKYGPKPGYQLDGVAACRLAWQWFFGIIGLPERFFLERKVNEPMAVRLAGEYDIWDKRDPRAALLQHGLRALELAPEIWADLLSEKDGGRVASLLERGAAVEYAKAQENADIITRYGFDVLFEGLTFLACNQARYNSHLFTAGLQPHHEACLGFNWDGPQRHWRVSLYHAPGKEHHDLAAIAVKYGGGGHRGACGFRLEKLPFLP